MNAAQNNLSLNIQHIRKPFGVSKEAYLRPCYEDIVKCIAKQLPKEIIENEVKAKLFIIRGSSGIGKSTFLAYFLLWFRGEKNDTLPC